MFKNLTRSLIRASFFLFLISAVGLLGLNGSLDPRNVTRIQAHDIIIELTSNSGNTLSFGVNANCSVSAMAPGDSCIANVVLENTGEGAYTLTAPTIMVSGPLSTCDGGGRFTASIGPLSYTPNVSIVDVGDTETLNVTAALNINAGNPCQGLTGTIVISLTANATDDGIEEPSTPVSPGGSGAGPQPTSQVAGTQATSTAVRTPTPQATFIAEVLPSRLPSTGHGGSSEAAAGIFQTLFLGIGLIAIGLLIAAAALKAQDRGGSR